MPFPEAANFSGGKLGDAWWSVSAPDGKLYVMETMPSSFLERLIITLSDATDAGDGFRTGFESFDGRHPRVSGVDLSWTNHQAAALWWLAKKLGAPAARLDAIAADARAGRVGPETMRAAAWVAYHQPTQPQGMRGQEEPTVSAASFQVPLDRVTIAPGAKPWNTGALKFEPYDQKWPNEVFREWIATESNARTRLPTATRAFEAQALTSTYDRPPMYGSPLTKGQQKGGGDGIPGIVWIAALGGLGYWWWKHNKVTVTPRRARS